MYLAKVPAKIQTDIIHCLVQRILGFGRIRVVYKAFLVRRMRKKEKEEMRGDRVRCYNKPAEACWKR